MLGRGADRDGLRAQLIPGGARLGVIVATAIWVWLALVDLIAGQPFRTFTVLGGIALFTVLHYLVNIAYG
ncbi:MAG TPA: hypothetical protein VJN39_04385 [Gemmatimonadales bacterium]|nr:hypothetical protein [Gemmatimonadales bacterium]